MVSLGEKLSETEEEGLDLLEKIEKETPQTDHRVLKSYSWLLIATFKVLTSPV